MGSSAKDIRAGGAFVEIFAKDGKLRESLASAQKHVGKFVSGVQSISKGIGLAGAAITAPLLAAGKVFADMGNQALELSQRTGISVEALTSLGLAAASTGIDGEELGKGISKMNKFVYEAATGSAQANGVMDKLGITLNELNDMTPDQMFKRFATAIDSVGNPAAKSALAMEAFGKSGYKFLPFIEGGAAGIEKLESRFSDLGPMMSEKTAKGARDLTISMNALEQQLKLIVFQVGSAAAPAIQQLMDKFNAKKGAKLALLMENKGLIAAVASVAIVAGGAMMIFAAKVAIIGPILAGLGTGIGFIVTIFTTLFSVVMLLFNPFVLLGIALAAIAVLCMDLNKTFDEAKAIFNEFAEVFEDALGGIKDSLNSGDVDGAFKILMKGLEVAWRMMTASLRQQWVAFISWVETSFYKLQNIFDKQSGRIAVDLAVMLERNGLVPKGTTAQVIGENMRAIKKNDQGEKDDKEKRDREFLEVGEMLDKEVADLKADLKQKRNDAHDALWWKNWAEDNAPDEQKKDVGKLMDSAQEKMQIGGGFDANILNRQNPGENLQKQMVAGINGINDKAGKIADKIGGLAGMAFE